MRAKCQKGGTGKNEKRLLFTVHYIPLSALRGDAGVVGIPMTGSNNRESMRSLWGATPTAPKNWNRSDGYAIDMKGLPMTHMSYLSLERRLLCSLPSRQREAFYGLLWPGGAS